MRTRPLVARSLLTRSTVDRRPLLEQRQLGGRTAPPTNPLVELTFGTHTRQWIVRIPTLGFEKRGRNRRTLLREALKRLR